MAYWGRVEAKLGVDGCYMGGMAATLCQMPIEDRHPILLLCWGQEEVVVHARPGW